MTRRALILLLVLLAARPGAAEEPTLADALPGTCQRPLRFGLAPYLSEGVLRDAFEPVLAYVSRRIGVPIHLVIPQHYADMLDLLQRHEIDLAYLTPVLYLKARREDPGLRLLVSEVWHGVDFYTGYLIVVSGRGIDSLDDLKGRRLAYVDHDSASGYLLPRRELRVRGFPPEQTFAQIIFSGDHTHSVDLLLSGQVDVAAVSSSTLATARRTGVDASRLRILAKTGTIPHDAICAASTMPDDLVRQVTETLLSLNSRTPEGRAILPRAPRLNGWRAGDPSEYDALDRILREEEAAP